MSKVKAENLLESVLPCLGIGHNGNHNGVHEVVTPRGVVLGFTQQGEMWRVTESGKKLREEKRLKDALYWVLIRYGRGKWDLAEIKRRFAQVDEV